MPGARTLGVYSSDHLWMDPSYWCAYLVTNEEELGEIHLLSCPAGAEKISRRSHRPIFQHLSPQDEARDETYIISALVTMSSILSPACW